MNLSVSVINPSQIAREGLCRIINDAGLQVVAAVSTAEAVGTAGDLVLIDNPHPTEQVRSVEALRAMNGRGVRPALSRRLEAGPIANWL